ncbi:TROVE domain-containing protein [Actinomadura gamaensis]|uniref:TROVE domain-containing protein n=1 Tax=Actinomadura gamaensis TaxID=1763541 RepID=A0ABV9U2V8_9ACTN
MPREYLPNRVLGDAKVWEALVETVGLTALIRNLARMTQIRTLKPLEGATRRAVKRLTDQDALAAARIQPMDLYPAGRVYQSGQAQPHPRADVRRWTPVPEIADALDGAYDLLFGNVVPSGGGFSSPWTPRPR